MKREHQANCPRLGFWDAGEWDVPCFCNPPPQCARCGKFLPKEREELCAQCDERRWRVEMAKDRTMREGM